MLNPKPKSRIRFIHPNPKKKIRSGAFVDLRPGDFFEFGVHGEIYRGKYFDSKLRRGKTLIEKVYRSKEDQIIRRARHPSNARRDFRIFKELTKFIPRKYFPTTARLKLEKRKSPSLIFTDLTENGKYAVLHLDQIHDTPYSQKIFSLVSSLKFLALSHGWELPEDVFMIQVDPWTEGHWQLFIVDLGNVVKVKKVIW